MCSQKFDAMKILTKVLIFAFIFCSIYGMEANGDPKSPKFVTVKAEKGDGVFSLLRKYELANNACNRAQFYILNNLNNNGNLVQDSEYKLPLILYDYNGISIRTTIGIDDWDKALRIKEYNHKALQMLLKSENYIESKQLWVPYNEIYCDNKNANEYELPSEPASGNYVIEPLFGANHSRVKVDGYDLKDKVYYLVSGHGGPDPGARCTNCPNTLCEDEYAYDVVLRLASNLMSQGAIVHIIIQDKNDGIRTSEYLPCDKDETAMGDFKIPINQIRRLEQRAKSINELYKKYKRRGIKDQYAIMVHVDSRSKESRQDVFFYHYEHGKDSKKLANKMQETFRNKYDTHQKNRGYKGFVASRNLYMVINTLPTSLYVELANIKNADDQKRILLPSNRQALADWLAEGLYNFALGK